MHLSGVRISIFPQVTSPRTSERSLSSKEFRSRLAQAGTALPDKASLLLNSFPFVTNKTPSISDLSGPLGAIRIFNAGRFVTDRFAQSGLPIIDGLDRKSRLTDSKIDVLDDLKSSIKRLKNTVSGLLGKNSFNNRAVKNSRPDLVEVTAGSQSSLSRFSVRPSRLSSSNVLASNEQSQNPLGLAGDFFINGVNISVSASDSLTDIKDKINFGEDINKNGLLDPAEDLNENGVADVLRVDPSEFGSGVFVIEDANNNGILEPAEDQNNNNRLDGGIQGHNVIATIENNRLVLTSQTGGASSIDLRDIDGVLLSLGFFELNSKGFPVQKESQLDNSVDPPKDLNITAEKAEIELDGESFKSDTNFFSEPLEDTSLTVKEVSTREALIQITLNAENVIKQIKNLFEGFNQVVGKLNNSLSRSGFFARDVDVQGIRTGLTQNPQSRIRETEKRNDNIDAISHPNANPKLTGLKIINTEKSDLQEVAVSRAVATLREEMTLPFRNLGNELFQRLSSIGIISDSDDTVKVLDGELSRALETNSAEVFDLLNNPETGILPQLDTQLDSILREGLGDIDFKIDRLKAVSEIPSEARERFRRLAESLREEFKFKTLISVA